MNSVTTFLNQFLDVPTLDPEAARRSKLLNIILMGFELITVVTLILVTTLYITNPIESQSEETNLFLIALISMVVLLAIIYVINRYWSGTIASTLFLLVLVGVLSVADTPEEVTAGRTLFLFTAPIIMSSVLLPPWSSFVTAVVVSVVISVMSLNLGVFNPAVHGGFMTVAFITWLSARSLENALVDLRQTNTELEAINRELDQRVIERTAELAQALELVNQEAQKTQAILTSIADGVLVLDDKGKAFVANPAIEQLIGMRPDQILNCDMQEIMGEHVRPEEQSLLLEKLAEKEQSEQNLRIDWGDKTLSITFATVRDSGGDASGKVVVFRDYSSEAELDRMKSAFVSMASHELRTPLNAILGYSDMMKVEVLGPLNEEQGKTMERVIANVNRMLGLVNNLLDSAQIEAGRLEPNFQDFSMNDLLNDVTATMYILAEQKGLYLKTSVEDEVPKQLTSDPQRLRQILINLLGNAIKFTTKGGITVRVFRPDEENWAFEVADTGVGIPPDAQGYVFESFRQVNDPITRKTTGSGLGLSIVKQLAELLGGDIKLYSKVDKGSTFTVTLPIDITPVQQAIKLAAAEAS